MELFHITPKRNLISIMTLGLKADYKRGLTICGTRHKRIFLTNNTTKILTLQCGKDWVKKHKPIVLIVRTDNYEVTPVVYDCFDPPFDSGFEFKCVGPVHPDAIRIGWEVKWPHISIGRMFA